jgi:hypothetical protein
MVVARGSLSEAESDTGGLAALISSSTSSSRAVCQLVLMHWVAVAGSKKSHGNTPPPSLNLFSWGWGGAYVAVGANLVIVSVSSSHTLSFSPLPFPRHYGRIAGTFFFFW